MKKSQEYRVQYNPNDTVTVVPPGRAGWRNYPTDVWRKLRATDDAYQAAKSEEIAVLPVVGMRYDDDEGKYYPIIGEYKPKKITKAG